MKGVVWLASGLLLALLLVSGISVGSQMSLPSNFFPTQELKSFSQNSGPVLDRINQTAAVASTGDTVSNWLSPITNWLSDLWFRFIEAWKRFLG
ncbi:MAG: hypothetical protein WC537_00150, partial [Candidatus Paceibacterota bacterium]